MSFVRTFDAATASRSAFRYVGSLFHFPALVWANRYMVQNFLRRDLMARVNGSFLGIGWILLQPMFLFTIYYLVFGIFLGDWKQGQAPDPTFAMHLFSGVIVFHALTEATTQSCAMIVDNGNLVKKVAFPSEVLLVHVAAVSIVIFAVGAVVCTIAGLLLGVAQPTWLMLALPLVVAAQFVLTLGIGLLLANLYVFVRDTAQLWRLATMSWMFLSPVFWQPKDLVDSGKLSAELVGWMEALNPAWSLMQAQRIALGGPEALLGSFWPHLGTAWAWAMGSMLVGYCVFMSRKHKFSDLI